MNKIKTVLTSLCITIGLSLSAQNVITATEASVTINHETTREGLVQLRTALLAQGYDFKYSPIFNNDRKLVSISFNVSANNGQVVGSGSHNSMLNPAASMTFQLNKTTGNFAIDSKGDIPQH